MTMACRARNADGRERRVVNLNYSRFWAEKQGKTALAGRAT